MSESLEIPVMYKGEELSFPCKIMRTGYSYSFQVEVDGNIITFEPDEEQKYRAVLAAETTTSNSKVDVNLIKAIGEVIESIVS